VSVCLSVHSNVAGSLNTTWNLMHKLSRPS